MPSMTHHKMPRAFLAVLVLCVSVASVCAQDQAPTEATTISPQKLQLMKELLELVNSRKTIEAMFKTQAEQMDKEVPESTWRIASMRADVDALTTEQREELRLQVLSGDHHPGQKVYQSLLKEIDFDKLIEETSVPLYDKYFSEAELSDLLAFYKSATGQKVLKVLPNLLSESIDQTAKIMMPKIFEIVTRVQKEETQQMEAEIEAILKTQEKPKPPRPPRKRSRR
jgi:hypothetical protein